MSKRNVAGMAKILAVCAMALALACVTSEIRLFHFPFGGSITLFSMLFVSLIGFWYGPIYGFTGAIAYGLLQFVMNPYFVSVPQMLCDYIFAYGVFGISGLFSKRKWGMILGYLFGGLGRWFFTILSGVVFFADYAPEGMPVILYSTVYNGAYILPEMVLTIILLFTKPVRNAFVRIKQMTTQN